MLSGDHPNIKPLIKAFKAAADPGNAVFQKAYMRNQFEFFGIKTEIRRGITKNYFRSINIEDHATLEKLVKELWHLPQREYQYAAQELLEHNKKIWTEETIELIEFCITHKSWWDTVDALNSYGSGLYFQKFPASRKAISSRWNRSSNIWLNRSSLLFQLKYKGKTDTDLLGSYIKHLSGSKEFFIQKAIGWILREYSKTDPVWVKKFIRENQLANLSVKEGSKYLKKEA
ncbi:MAG TPA: DNA alkylation repair protein [Chitinophagaceae bacterium]|nr:DNA alkylation repair protein [Chitinophagaceae bacterium]